MLLQRTIQIGFPHRVFFTRDAFSPQNHILRELLSFPGASKTRVLAVLDGGLQQARPQLPGEIDQYLALCPGVILVADPLILKGGEELKNSPDALRACQEKIFRHGIDRHSVVLAIGGGALLDVAGFAAATAHRGVRLVRMPTTTLSQADAGVGVKNGINAFGQKNFLGTFSVPFAVVNDSGFLDCLPPRVRRAGCVEAVKVACLRDRSFFERMEREAAGLAKLDPGALEWMIRRSAELHLDHIAGSGDPFEMGSARPLDFGHWAGHKLEQLSGNVLSHGEAVAVGIALDVVYSRRMGWLEPATAERILALLERLHFALFAAELLRRDAQGKPLILDALDEFRQHLGGQLTVTMLKGIGLPFAVHALDGEVVLAAIAELAQRQPSCPRTFSASERPLAT